MSRFSSTRGSALAWTVRRHLWTGCHSSAEQSAASGIFHKPPHLDADFVESIFKAMFGTFLELMKVAHVEETGTGGNPPDAPQQDEAPHPFASLLPKLENAFQWGAFIGKDGVLCAADCRLSIAVHQSFMLRLVLLWPQRGNCFQMSEQLSELAKDFAFDVGLVWGAHVAAFAAALQCRTVLFCVRSPYVVEAASMAESAAA